MQRVLVLGSSCSGKTTFARTLAERINAKCIELDSLHWGPNWTPVPRDLFRQRATEAAGHPKWIIDGNYVSVRELTWSRATTLIWLDYSFRVVFSRALKRTSRRVFTGERIYANNRETFQQAFLSRDSILWWVITTFRSHRRQVSELLNQHAYSHLQLLRFGCPSETDKFLASVVTGPDAASDASGSSKPSGRPWK